MSQLSPPTNLLLACLAALGLVPALGLPWYASVDPVEPTDSKGSIELLAEGVARWFTSDGVTATGAEALARPESALMAVGAATVVLAAAMLVPALRALVRGPLQLVPLAAPLIVLVVLVDQPGSNPTTELRWGAFVALGLALFMASAAAQGANLTARRIAPSALRPPARLR